jgi:hypothetical protein
MSSRMPGYACEGAAWPIDGGMASLSAQGTAQRRAEERRLIFHASPSQLQNRLFSGARLCRRPVADAYELDWFC